MYRRSPDVPSARSAHRLARDGRQERRLLGARSLLHTDDCRELHRPRHPTGQGVEVVSRLLPVPSLSRMRAGVGAPDNSGISLNSVLSSWRHCRSFAGMSLFLVIVCG